MKKYSFGKVPPLNLPLLTRAPGADHPHPNYAFGFGPKKIFCLLFHYPFAFCVTCSVEPTTYISLLRFYVKGPTLAVPKTVQA